MIKSQLEMKVDWLEAGEWKVFLLQCKQHSISEETKNLRRSISRNVSQTAMLLFSTINRM